MPTASIEYAKLSQYVSEFSKESSGWTKNEILFKSMKYVSKKKCPGPKIWPK
jgi:hypothetical protein